jgi:hypothetical protein
LKTKILKISKKIEKFQFFLKKVISLEFKNKKIKTQENLKYRCEKNSIFHFEFEGSKKNPNKISRVDTLSYKKLFHPTSYTKVITILSRHKAF